MPLREWVREDVGLLDDERYISMPDYLIVAWEVLLKATARLPGERYRDEDQIIFQLKRYGRARPLIVLRELKERGWIVPCADGEGLRIKGWEKYQLVYRGPSDDPIRKAERNAARPTTDAARRAAAADRAQSQRADDAKARGNGVIVSFKDAMKAAGFNPAVVGEKDNPAAIDEPAAAAVD